MILTKKLIFINKHPYSRAANLNIQLFYVIKIILGDLVKNKIAIIVGFILLLSSNVFAQGHLVNKPFALGYSGSILPVGEKGYYVNTVGVTLLSAIDIYRGFTRVNGRDISITGTNLYIRKKTNQIFYPVISFAMTEIKKDFYPGFGVGFVIRVQTKDDSFIHLVPNCAINYTGYEWKFSGGADISIGGYLSENVGFYTEPGFSISEGLSWNLEIGLVFQYGKAIGNNK